MGPGLSPELGYHLADATVTCEFSCIINERPSKVTERYEESIG